MHKDEVELFLKRGKNFLDGAKERFQKEDALEAIKIAEDIKGIVENVRYND